VISVTKLDGGFGATIAGVDLSAAMAEDTVKGILDAFYAHQVIVIPGQSLSTDRFIEIGRLFGTPQPHVLRHLHHDGHPEILLLSNVMKDGEPVGIYDGAAYWHTDQSYDAEPASATVVHAVQVPARGGETRFADMYRAYDTLPDTTKRRIDGLTVCHRYGNRDDPDGKTRHGAAKLRGQQKAAVRAVTHPLVRSHPITGRKALYAVAGTSHGIVGMADEAAVALLDELKAHATQSRFTYSHAYGAGDVVAWDDTATLHAATLIDPATGPDDTRMLYRLSIKGAPDAFTPV